MSCETLGWSGTPPEKGVHQVFILSPCLFNLDVEGIMQNAGWMKYKLESRLPGEISITSDMQMTPPLCRKQRGTEEPLDESSVQFSCSVVSDSQSLLDERGE